MWFYRLFSILFCHFICSSLLLLLYNGGGGAAHAYSRHLALTFGNGKRIKRYEKENHIRKDEYGRWPYNKLYYIYFYQKREKGRGKCKLFLLCSMIECTIMFLIIAAGSILTIYVIFGGSELALWNIEDVAYYYFSIMLEPYILFLAVNTVIWIMLIPFGVLDHLYHINYISGDQRDVWKR